MKNTLSISVLICLMITSVVHAQTKIWDFGNSSAWPVSAGYSSETLTDNLAMIPGSGVSNMAAVELNSATFSADGYTATKRFKLNGGSWDTGVSSYVMPTKRFIYFAVNGSCTVRVWFKTGGSGTRTLYVTNGSSVIGSLGSSSSSDPLILTANYTGGAGNIYIGADQACNIYKIEVTGQLGTTTLSTLGTANSPMKSKAKVYAKGNTICIADLNSKNTNIQIYTASGSLVKTVKTSSDINFDLKSGVYIVTVKSAEGEKSVKVLLN